MVLGGRMRGFLSLHTFAHAVHEPQPTGVGYKM